MNNSLEVALTSFGIVYPRSRKALAVAKTSLPLYLAYWARRYGQWDTTCTA